MQTLTTTPIANPLISTMPSCSSSVEDLIARATDRGYYLLPPSPVEVPSTLAKEVIDIDALPDLPYVEVTDTKLVLHPPKAVPAPPGLTCPPTPALHMLR